MGGGLVGNETSGWGPVGITPLTGYFGKTKVSEARSPKSGFDSAGDAIGIFGPIDSETICPPSLVTPLTEKFRKTIVDSVIQF